MNSLTDPGFNNINFRFNRVPYYTTDVISSVRKNVDNSQYWCNSPGIPVNGLDITFPTELMTFGIASSSADDTENGNRGKNCKNSWFGFRLL